MNRTIQDLLYAPIGLVAGASEMIPELADQGRLQVNNARMMGQMATRMGSAKITAGVEEVAAHLHGLLVQSGLVPPDTDYEPADSTVKAQAHRVDHGTPAARTEAPATDTPDAQDLAIVDYDSLAASQVVPRLAALKPSELEAVRRYELATRGRKTILGRVAQLQG